MLLIYRNNLMKNNIEVCEVDTMYRIYLPILSENVTDNAFLLKVIRSDGEIILFRFDECENTNGLKIKDYIDDLIENIFIDGKLDLRDHKADLVYKKFINKDLYTEFLNVIFGSGINVYDY